MNLATHRPIRSVTLCVAALGCAGWDNPTALNDLQLAVEFELPATALETFKAIEIHVHVSEDGLPVVVVEPQLEIAPSGFGALTPGARA